MNASHYQHADDAAPAPQIPPTQAIPPPSQNHPIPNQQKPHCKKTPKSSAFSHPSPQAPHLHFQDRASDRNPDHTPDPNHHPAPHHHYPHQDPYPHPDLYPDRQPDQATSTESHPPSPATSRSAPHRYYHTTPASD